MTSSLACPPGTLFRDIGCNGLYHIEGCTSHAQIRSAFGICIWAHSSSVAAFVNTRRMLLPAVANGGWLSSA
eukprot:3744234-Karenia_brevis.AAC.1